jgi:hypothetical protein
VSAGFHALSRSQARDRRQRDPAARPSPWAEWSRRTLQPDEA